MLETGSVGVFLLLSPCRLCGYRPWILMEIAWSCRAVVGRSAY